MKRLLIAIILCGLIGSSTSCNHQPEKKGSETEATKKKGKYVCTMDPLVTSDTPGVCPKCGMQMVERDTIGDK